MPPIRPSKKPNTGMPGVKMLITAASLAATVGGWALISAKETKPVQPPASAQVVAPQVVAPQVVAPAFSIKLAPLPTLVPPGQQPIITINNPRAVANAPQRAVASAQPAPQAAPQPALVLRDVSAPAPSSGAPAPAAQTGSSR